MYNELVKKVSEATNPFAPMGKAEQDAIYAERNKAVDPAKLAKVTELVEKGEDLVEDYKSQVDTEPDYKTLHFNIKMHGLHIPEEVQKFVEENHMENQFEQVYQDELGQYLNNFMTGLQKYYHWYINDWVQDGRSGGWVVLSVDSSEGYVEQIENITSDYRANRTYDMSFSEFVDYAIPELTEAIEELEEQIDAIYEIGRKIEWGRNELIRAMNQVGFWNNIMKQPRKKKNVQRSRKTSI